MKKAILGILLFVAYTSHAQYTIPQGLGGPSTLVTVGGGLKVPQGLIFGNFADTTAANATQADFYDGCFIYAGTDLYLRKAGAWVKYGGGTVYSFGKTDNYGIVSSVTNPTTTPVHAVGVDSTVIASQARVQNGLNAVNASIALKQNLVTLTTNFSSGPATFNQTTGALNVPQYAGGGGGTGDSVWIDPKDFFTGGVTLYTATTAQKTTAFQAAIRYAQDNKYGVKFNNTWQVNPDSLLITKHVNIVGSSDAAELVTSVNTGTLLKVSVPVAVNFYNVIFEGYKGVVLKDFKVRYNGSTPSSTSIGIAVTVDTSISFRNRLFNVTVQGFYTGVHMNNTHASQIENCYFRNNRAYGILNTCPNSDDYGDQIFSHNIFSVHDTVTNIIDSSAHIRWTSGAMGEVSFNKFYGYTHAGVWVQLNLTGGEAFPASVSSEYRIIGNRFSFLKGWGVILDTEFGKTGSGAGTLTGNRIQGVSILDNQNNNGKFLDIRGGARSIWDVHVQNNQSVTDGVADTVRINANSITNLTFIGNTINASSFSTNTSFSGATKAVVVNGTFAGKVVAHSNAYIGFPTRSDLNESVVFNAQSDPATIGVFAGSTKGVRIGVNGTTGGSVEGVDYTGSASFQPLFLGGSDVRVTSSSVEKWRFAADGSLINTSTGLFGTTANTSLRFMANNSQKMILDSNGRVGIGTNAPGVTLDVTGTANVYARFTRPNNSNDNGFIFAPNGALSSSNPQFFMGMAGGSSYYAFQRYDGTTATNVLNISATANRVGILTPTPSEALEVAGNISLSTAGNKIKIATGTNASVGTATLVAGTVTVSTTAAVTASKIFVTVTTPGGVQGFLSVPTIVNGTSFTITSTSAAETSLVNWWIIN